MAEPATDMEHEHEEKDQQNDHEEEVDETDEETKQQEEEDLQFNSAAAVAKINFDMKGLTKEWWLRRERKNIEMAFRAISYDDYCDNQYYAYFPC